MYDYIIVGSVGNGIFDQQKIVFSIDVYDFQGLNGYLFCIQMIGYFFVFEYLIRSLVLVDGIWDVVGNGVIVGVILIMEVLVFDGVCEVFIFGFVGNVYYLVCLEQIDSDLVISGILFFVQMEFLYVVIGGDICFGKVISLCFGNVRSMMFVGGDLYCMVVIGFFSFELGDVIWFDFDDCNWNRDIFFGENVGYVVFMIDNINCYVVNFLSVWGFYLLWLFILECYMINVEGIS